jgi:hypothetical protein
VLLRTQIATVATALALMIGQASADTYTNFTLSGSFSDPFHDNWSLSGAMTVDDTTDVFTSASLRLVGESWTNIISQGLSGNYYNISIQTPVLNSGCSPSSNCFDTLSLGFSAVPAALVAAGEGSILSGYSHLQDAGFAISLVGTGSLIDPPSPTPLPGTFPVFAVGLGVVGLWAWWRKKKANTIDSASVCNVGQATF